MPLAIRPSDVGRRVSVQYFDEAGSPAEVVGTLERVDLEAEGPVFHIRRKDDRLVCVPLRRVRHGRVVPASRR